jgi:hypothetical protein
VVLKWLVPVLLAYVLLRGPLQEKGLRFFRPTVRGLFTFGMAALLIAMFFGRFGLFGPRFGWNGRAHDLAACKDGWLLPASCWCSDNDGSVTCCHTADERDQFNVPACE